VVSDTGSSSRAAPSGSAPARATFPEFPPIVIPDVTALTESSGRFAESLADLATPVSGISVVGARCDTTGKVVTGAA
jgi:hypothetical protein